MSVECSYTLVFRKVTLRISGLLANMFLKIFSVDADLKAKKKNLLRLTNVSEGTSVVVVLKA